MPIREYQCTQCHAEFEELVFGNEAPACTACGSAKVEPLMSCCRVHGSGHGAGGGEYSMPASSGSGCAGCSGGHCSTCH